MEIILLPVHLYRIWKISKDDALLGLETHIIGDRVDRKALYEKVAHLRRNALPIVWTANYCHSECQIGAFLVEERNIDCGNLSFLVAHSSSISFEGDRLIVKLAEAISYLVLAVILSVAGDFEAAVGSVQPEVGSAGICQVKVASPSHDLMPFHY